MNRLQVNGSDRELIDLIAELERLKSACAAIQVRATHAFVTSQTVDGASRGVSADRTRRSVVGAIALARKESPTVGRRLIGDAEALVCDMPLTLAALAAGETSDRRVRLVVEQFGCLSAEDRRRADRMITRDLDRSGDRAAAEAAARIAARLDPAAVMAKIRRAVKNRHVTVRSAPDSMSRLSAVLPAAQGAAVQAALKALADQTIAAPGGDPRTRGQIMADSLVSRVTGEPNSGCDEYGVPCDVVGDTDGPEANDSTADDSTIDDSTIDDSANADESDEAADGSADDDLLVDLDEPAYQPSGRGAPVVQLSVVMTDQALFGDDNEPAHVVGQGSIPASLARALLGRHADKGTKIWMRRFYTNPSGTQLLAADSRQRLFPQGARDFLIARDQTCRTPWCDAPIRHLDHIVDHARGGPTAVGNGQGLCAACNLIKAAPGWNATADNDGAVETRTPTGHRYLSRPPRPPHSRPWPSAERPPIDVCTLVSELIPIYWTAA